MDTTTKNWNAWSKRKVLTGFSSSPEGWFSLIFSHRTKKKTNQGKRYQDAHHNPDTQLQILKHAERVHPPKGLQSKSAKPFLSSFSVLGLVFYFFFFFLLQINLHQSRTLHQNVGRWFSSWQWFVWPPCVWTCPRTRSQWRRDCTLHWPPSGRCIPQLWTNTATHLGKHIEQEFDWFKHKNNDK